ncbi:MAG TPA: MBL fold metallo-hydrolase [Micropepsaceae bacterium]|nr:MBL fold metallo-hydrolase [Micropepsaceae bacterium]
MLDIKGFFDPATATVTYLVADKATGQAAIVDPVLDYEPKAARTSTASIDAVLAEAKSRNLAIAYVLETHAHADHLSAGSYVRERTGAKVVIGAAITKVQALFKTIFNASDVKPDGSAFDVLVSEGDTLKLGETTIRVLHTPGHTPACVTYVANDAAFVGDTVFMPDYGTARTDFPGGDAATLYRSIRKILSLPGNTRVLTGHDYPPPSRKEPAWEASVAEHRARNIHIHDGISEADFVAMRTGRDKTLAPPVLILPSLQVNIRAGAMPPAENDGHVYLKLPVNRLGKA